MTDFISPQYPLQRAQVSSLDTFSLRFHQERDRLFNELHTRPFPVLEEGARVSQLSLIHI